MKLWLPAAPPPPISDMFLHQITFAWVGLFFSHARQHACNDPPPRRQILSFFFFFSPITNNHMTSAMKKIRRIFGAQITLRIEPKVVLCDVLFLTLTQIN